VLRLLTLLLGALVGVGLVVAVAARLSDGPLGLLPGGPFHAATEPGAPDPTVVGALDTVELEVDPAAPRSRHTWIVALDGALYVPAGLARFKRWPHEAEADGRVRLRAAGHVWALRAVRVQDPELIDRLFERLAAKYGLSRKRGALAASTWFFRLEPRHAD
jgi:hypothetical protein